MIEVYLCVNIRTRSLAEVACQQALEGAAMAGFVTSHFMDCIVDGIQVQFLGALGQIDLALSGAELGGHAGLQIGLRGVAQHLAQQFS